MEPVQILLLSALAFSPLVILFGPILSRILGCKEFNYKTDAISTLRDLDSTRRNFLIWINLYMLLQVVYLLISLPIICVPPISIYILGLGSLLLGTVAFCFRSSTLKHKLLIGLSCLLTIFSLFGVGLTLFNTDVFLAVATNFVACVMLSTLVLIPLKRLRMWLAEYLALGALAIWNVVILVKLVLTLSV